MKTANITKLPPKTTSTQLSMNERVELYRQLGMINAANELVRQMKKDSSSWRGIHYLTKPFTSYLITYVVLAALFKECILGNHNCGNESFTKPYYWWYYMVDF